MSALDPNTTVGTILVQVVAGLLLAGLLGGIAWIGGPLKWLIQARQLRSLLLGGRRFTFVFNPAAGKAKTVTFLPNGDIGEGRNNNEHTWRISRGRLEIFAADGGIYSRFERDKVSGYLRHTNDIDTRSIHGQYFQPEFVPWKQTGKQ